MDSSQTPAHPCIPMEFHRTLQHGLAAVHKTFTRTHSRPGGVDIGYSFTPLSLTIFNLDPSGPRLLVVPGTQANPNQFLFTLEGQAGGSYVLENSPNLASWIPYATITLSSSTATFTNLISPE